MPNRGGDVEDQRIQVSDLALPVVAVDAHGNIVYTNTRAVSLFGYDDPADLHGLPVETLIPDKRRKVHKAHVAGWMDNPHPRSMVGSSAVVTGEHRSGKHLRLRVALQWDPVSRSGIALIHHVPEPGRWWLRPKAGAAAMLLVAGVILAGMEVAIGNAMLGAAFGMLTALAGKGDQGDT